MEPIRAAQKLVPYTIKRHAPSVAAALGVDAVAQVCPLGLGFGVHFVKLLVGDFVPIFSWHTYFLLTLPAYRRKAQGTIRFITAFWGVKIITSKINRGAYYETGNMVFHRKGPIFPGLLKWRK